VEPATKRVIAFFDAQNLFFAAKELWGYHWPNYDPPKLAQAICGRYDGWNLIQNRFYTGVPLQERSYEGNIFWQNKLLALSRAGVITYRRHLVYRQEEIELNDGTLEIFNYAQEKGVDVRIALDMLMLAVTSAYDIALVFSQDQDLSEAVEDVRKLAANAGRWILVASAYPHEPTSNRNDRGISNTLYCPIDRATYDACIDPRDYRPRMGSPRRPRPR
jgi:uncharacterized LabA/DUF88 family protein